MKYIAVLILTTVIQMHGAEYVEYYFHGDWGTSTSIKINDDNTYVCKTIKGKEDTENITKQGKLADGSYAALMTKIKDNGLVVLESGGLIKAVHQYQISNSRFYSVCDAGTPKLIYFVDGKQRVQQYPGALALTDELRGLKEFVEFIQVLEYIETLTK